MIKKIYIHPSMNKHYNWRTAAFRPIIETKVLNKISRQEVIMILKSLF